MFCVLNVLVAPGNSTFLKEEPYYDLDVVVSNNTNHKSLVIEWAQRNNKELRFDITEAKKDRNSKEFSAQVIIDEQPFGTGYGFTKKKAEQDAAQKSCEMLGIIKE